MHYVSLIQSIQTLPSRIGYHRRNQPSWSSSSCSHGLYCRRGWLLLVRRGRFRKVQGVKEVTSGYAGGKTKNPTYKEVTRGGTGHYEVVKIDFDPSVITIDSVLHMFLRSVDPTDAGGQFCDRGESYRTAIFPNGAAQKSAAQKAIKDAQSDLGQTVVTPIVTLGTFYEAEGYHQNYYKGDDIVLTRFGPRKQSKAYELYRDACGRDKRVKQLWGPAAPFAK